MQKLLQLILSGLLAGCGGGGGEESPAGKVAVSTPVTPTVSSTALKNNTVAMTSKFEQFDLYLAQIPEKTSLFISKTIFIKIYTKDGNTLFLGRYLPAIRLQLQVPKHLKSVKIDIFSTDKADPQLTEEIRL